MYYMLTFVYFQLHSPSAPLSHARKKVSSLKAGVLIWNLEQNQIHNWNLCFMRNKLLKQFQEI